MHQKEEYERVIEKVAHVADHLPDFSPSERAVLREVVEAWRGWTVLKRFSKWTFIGLVAVGSFATTLIGAYSAVKGLFK